MHVYTLARTICQALPTTSQSSAFELARSLLWPKRSPRRKENGTKVAKNKQVQSPNEGEARPLWSCSTVPSSAEVADAKYSVPRGTNAVHKVTSVFEFTVLLQQKTSSDPPKGCLGQDQARKWSADVSSPRAAAFPQRI